jgi:hypothetical protein
MAIFIIEQTSCLFVPECLAGYVRHTYLCRQAWPLICACILYRYTKFVPVFDGSYCFCRLFIMLALPCQAFILRPLLVIAGSSNLGRLFIAVVLPCQAFMLRPAIIGYGRHAYLCWHVWPAMSGQTICAGIICRHT